MRTLTLSMALLVAGCGGEHCKGNEGTSLETACAFYDLGHKYEQSPKICGLSPNDGSSTAKFTGATGTCTCTITREFPTNFFYIRSCSYAATK